jgi:hypothetical protein
MDRIDQTPDPELGLALRDLLDDPTRDRALLMRLHLALRQMPQTTGMDILATWARPGLAAAALLAAGLGLWAAMRGAQPAQFDEASLGPTDEAMISAAVGTR